MEVPMKFNAESNGESFEIQLLNPALYSSYP